MQSLIHIPSLVLLVMTCAGLHGRAHAQPSPTILYSTNSSIYRLVDLNGDGDFLDSFERTIFANSTSANFSGLSATSQSLFVITGTSIQKLQDLNGDGDCLDANEVNLFAELSAQAVNPTQSAILTTNLGTRLVIDGANRTLIQLSDLDGDGDALDANEIVNIADDLVSPNAITQIDDFTFLISQTNAATPVRILEDRNHDGDYFDFAENISYVENQPIGLSIVTIDNQTQRHLRPGQSDIVTYHDANADGDALDANELIIFANNLDQPARMARAASTDTLYVFLANNNRELVALRDLNTDGDALDANEQIVVAAGLGNVNDITIIEPATTCTNGDADGSGTITVVDLSIFARILVGAPAPVPACPLDMNNDGKVDGRDIQPFIAALVGQ